MAIHIIDEANRCLNCKKPKCMEGCPVHTPIPHIIQMFKEHQVMDAGKELFQNNPMSVICSIVCDHEQYRDLYFRYLSGSYEDPEAGRAEEIGGSDRCRSGRFDCCHYSGTEWIQSNYF